MKNTIDHFKMLPENAAVEAIENTPDYLLNVGQESLKEALLGAFVWHHTPQGHKHWQDIYDSLD
jgi:hypothetical protein